MQQRAFSCSLRLPKRKHRCGRRSILVSSQAVASEPDTGALHRPVAAPRVLPAVQVGFSFVLPVVRTRSTVLTCGLHCLLSVCAVTCLLCPSSPALGFNEPACAHCMSCFLTAECVRSRTSGSAAVQETIQKFLNCFPTPTAVLAAPVAEICSAIRPVGLQVCICLVLCS